MADRYRAQSEQFRIHQVELPAAAVSTFSKFEVRFKLDATYTNPFDPDDIRVDAEIAVPDGRVVTVPAFFMVPYRSIDGQTWLQGGVSYRQTGEPTWMMRYTPTVPGNYRVRLVAVKPERGAAGRRTETEWFPFSVTAAAGKGFVQKSSDNPLYFENSGDGTLFFPVGTNIPWTRSNDRNLGRPDGSMEYYMGRAAGNMTATRVWMCHWAWLEWTPGPNPPYGSSWSGYGGLNFYNQMVASAFDRVFELGEKYGLRIMLTLDDNNEHEQGTSADGWSRNPYNVANGGPVSEPKGVFSHPEARRAYRNRLRYIIARWGYSTSLWALNSWNDYTNPGEVQVDWVREMRDYVHQLVDDVRPIFFGTNYRFAAQAVSDYAQAEAGKLVPGKPNVKQEVYYTSDTKWFLHTLKYELWMMAMRGKGGVMVWPHHIVDRLNAWSAAFNQLATFMESMPLHRKVFRPVQASITGGVLHDAESAASAPESVLRTISLNIYGDVPNWGVKAPISSWDIDVTESNHFLEGLGEKLYGERPGRLEWRTTPTFNITLPAPARMMVRIREVSGSAQLRVRNHGKIIADKLYAGNGRWHPTGDLEYLVAELPAGANSITLSLDGQGDWVSIGQIYIVYEVPDAVQALEVSGLTSGEEAVLYVWNPTHGEVAQKVLGVVPRTFKDVQLAVRGFASGRYQVELYGIDKGQVYLQTEATAEGDVLNIAVPQITRDTAIRVRRLY